MYFNPKAKLNGTSYALQPLGTEGQGIDGNPAPYSRIAIGLPIGLGAKYKLTRKIQIGIEISNTYTNSDYIDDAHDKYYDNDAIRDAYGDIAAELADRTIDEDGNDVTSDLIEDPSKDNTSVRFWFKGGESGKRYNLTVKVETNTSATLEEDLILIVEEVGHD